MAIDRISPITSLLDEVFYQSSIDNMRGAYFHHVKSFDSWVILSDYYFGDDKMNKVITFTLLPYLGGLPQLQTIIRALALRDIKHTRSIDRRFIEFLRQLPALNISFIFQQDKYFAWTSSGEFQSHMPEFCEILSVYVAHWRRDTTNHTRLDVLSRNIRHAQELLRQKKKSEFYVKLLLLPCWVVMLAAYSVARHLLQVYAGYPTVIEQMNLATI